MCRKIVGLILLMTLFGIYALAQSSTATLSGTVTDPNDAVVVGATVKITNTDTGFERTLTTNSDGAFTFSSLQPAKYQLMIEQTGFSTFRIEELVLNVSDVRSVKVQLKTGAVKESVQVTNDLPVLNESPAVSTVVDQQFVSNLPLNGRSFQSLIYLTPGVVITPASSERPGQFSVNGQRTNTNYFTIDGVSANFGISPANNTGQSVSGSVPALTAGGGTNGLISVDAMQEFRIQTSTYAPEFGRSPGAQISIVTKGGGNDWHGTAYNYLRNEVLDARSYFNKVPAAKPPLRQNNFGGTFSGPIIKKRTFFFFSYEGLRLLQPTFAEGYFPTAATKASVTGPWKAIINAVPTGTGALSNPNCDNINIPCFGLLKASFSSPSKFDAYSIRVDQTFADKYNLFARYNYSPSRQTSRSFATDSNTVSDTTTLTVALTAAFSSSLTNDFRFNWSRQASYPKTTNLADFGAVLAPASALFPPGRNADNSQSAFAYFGVPSFDVRNGKQANALQRQINIVDTLSKTFGKHQFKFGADFRRLHPDTQSQGGIGVFGFSWDSIRNGLVTQLLNSTADQVSGRMDNWSFFGQDTWQVSPQMTLTYGLRWEINAPPVSATPGKPFYAVTGIFDNQPLGIVEKGLWKTQWNALAPRIGIAYKVNPKTIIRGGFGFFYDLGYSGKVADVMGGLSFPYFRSKSSFGLPLDLSRPEYQPTPFSTTISFGSFGFPAFDPKLRLPVTYQWNAAFERELGSNQSISATYVGAYGDKLLYGFNVVPPGSVFALQGFGNINTTTNAASSRYNSLQLQFTRRLNKGLQALVSYTLSQSKDNASSDSNNQGRGRSITEVVAPPLTPSTFDIRNSFQAAVSYEIPTPEWGGKVGKAILGGWALDGIYRASAPPPLDVTLDFRDVSTGVRTITAARTGQPVWITDLNEPGGQRLNPDAFTLPTNGISDGSLRNGVRGIYGINQTDLALRRRFGITERVKLDFRFEFFNLFNHPMFGGSLAPNPSWGSCSDTNPNNCSRSSTFGKVSPGSTLNVGLGGAVNGGGQSSLYAPGGNRSAQATLKLSF